MYHQPQSQSMSEQNKADNIQQLVAEIVNYYKQSKTGLNLSDLTRSLEEKTGWYFNNKQVRIQSIILPNIIQIMEVITKGLPFLQLVSEEQQEGFLYLVMYYARAPLVFSGVKKPPILNTGNKVLNDINRLLREQDSTRYVSVNDFSFYCYIPKNNAAKSVSASSLVAIDDKQVKKLIEQNQLPDRDKAKDEQIDKKDESILIKTVAKEAKNTQTDPVLSSDFSIQTDSEAPKPLNLPEDIDQTLEQNGLKTDELSSIKIQEAASKGMNAFLLYIIEMFARYAEDPGKQKKLLLFFQTISQRLINNLGIKNDFEQLNVLRALQQSISIMAKQPGVDAQSTQTDSNLDITIAITGLDEMLAELDKKSVGVDSNIQIGTEQDVDIDATQIEITEIKRVIGGGIRAMLLYITSLLPKTDKERERKIKIIKLFEKIIEKQKGDVNQQDEYKQEILNLCLSIFGELRAKLEQESALVKITTTIDTQTDQRSDEVIATQTEEKPNPSESPININEQITQEQLRVIDPTGIEDVNLIAIKKAALKGADAFLVYIIKILAKCKEDLSKKKKLLGFFQTIVKSCSMTNGIIEDFSVLAGLQQSIGVLAGQPDGVDQDVQTDLNLDVIITEQDLDLKLVDFIEKNTSTDSQITDIDAIREAILGGILSMLIYVSNLSSEKESDRKRKENIIAFFKQIIKDSGGPEEDIDDQKTNDQSKEKDKNGMIKSWLMLLDKLTIEKQLKSTEEENISVLSNAVQTDTQGLKVEVESLKQKADDIQKQFIIFITEHKQILNQFIGQQQTDKIQTDQNISGFKSEIKELLDQNIQNIASQLAYFQKQMMQLTQQMQQQIIESNNTIKSDQINQTGQITILNQQITSLHNQTEQNNTNVVQKIDDLKQQLTETQEQNSKEKIDLNLRLKSIEEKLNTQKETNEKIVSEQQTIINNFTKQTTFISEQSEKSQKDVCLLNVKLDELLQKINKTFNGFEQANKITNEEAKQAKQQSDQKDQQIRLLIEKHDTEIIKITNLILQLQEIARLQTKTNQQQGEVFASQVNGITSKFDKLIEVLLTNHLKEMDSLKQDRSVSNEQHEQLIKELKDQLLFLKNSHDEQMNQMQQQFIQQLLQQQQNNQQVFQQRNNELERKLQEQESQVQQLIKKSEVQLEQAATKYEQLQSITKIDQQIRHEEQKKDSASEHSINDKQEQKHQQLIEAKKEDKVNATAIQARKGFPPSSGFPTIESVVAAISLEPNSKDLVEIKNYINKCRVNFVKSTNNFVISNPDGYKELETRCRFATPASNETLGQYIKRNIGDNQSEDKTNIATWYFCMHKVGAIHCANIYEEKEQNKIIDNLRSKDDWENVLFKGNDTTPKICEYGVKFEHVNKEKKLIFSKPTGITPAEIHYAIDQLGYADNIDWDNVVKGSNDEKIIENICLSRWKKVSFGGKESLLSQLMPEKIGDWAEWIKSIQASNKIANDEDRAKLMEQLLNEVILNPGSDRKDSVVLEEFYFAIKDMTLDGKYKEIWDDFKTEYVKLDNGKISDFANKVNDNKRLEIAFKSKNGLVEKIENIPGTSNKIRRL